MSLFEPYFADPTVLHVGCEAPHAYFIPFDTREGALRGNRNESAFFKSLSPEYRQQVVDRWLANG